MRVNPEFLRRGYLKKQNQFSKGQNDVKLIFTMLYGDFGEWRLQKNKANLRMGRMSLSIYMKGDYEELHALKAAKNKPNSKPIKANF